MRRLLYRYIKTIYGRLSIAFCLSLVSTGLFAQNPQPFEEWKQDLRPLMLDAGVDAQLAEQIIAHIQYLPRVIELDRRQPESTMSHETYLRKVIPEWKVQRARKLYARYYKELNGVARQTGVAERFIVALWGKESLFGKITGQYSVPSALATLAFDGRRADFFRKELINAAKILQQGHIRLEDMKGSWAGAMGHCQFMPSSFLRYAVDGDGDGKKDIWHNEKDVFASIANYLKKSGWDSEHTWGRQVKLLKAYESYQFGAEYRRPLSEWQAQGVRRYDLRDLPKVDIEAYLVAPGGKNGRIYLVYNNYDVLLRWNRSSYFATGVGYLADRIAYPAVPLVGR